MSRIGKLPISVPKNVTVSIDDKIIQIKSLNAILIQEIPKELKIECFENIITVIKKEETRLANQKYGLIRSLIFNMVLGVEKKFEKKIQMICVGYKAQIKTNELILNIGFTNPVIFKIPDGLDVIIEANTNLLIKGSDKNLVGLFASKIRANRPPEPYKGKGIRYLNEIVLRKTGKSGK
jgi:large subunit ribosomal protein L6